jgi:hypothetical protein
MLLDCRRSGDRPGNGTFPEGLGRLPEQLRHKGGEPVRVRSWCRVMDRRLNPLRPCGRRSPSTCHVHGGHQGVPPHRSWDGMAENSSSPSQLHGSQSARRAVARGLSCSSTRASGLQGEPPNRSESAGRCREQCGPKSYSANTAGKKAYDANWPGQTNSREPFAAMMLRFRHSDLKETVANLQRSGGGPVCATMVG